jgi:hypothetical protein
MVSIRGSTTMAPLQGAMLANSLGRDDAAVAL